SSDVKRGVRVEYGVDLVPDWRPHEVRDGERLRSLLPGEAHRGDRVGRLAGLRDPDHERVLGEYGVAVAPLRCDVGLDGNARPFLDDVAADDAGVVRRTARDDHDPPQILDLELRQPDPVEDELATARAVADRLADRLR